MNVNQKRTVAFALKSRIPSLGSNTEYVNAGGLMSYDAYLADGYRRVAYYRGQNSEGNQARRPAGRAADEI